MAITKVTSGLISADASSIDLNIDAGTLYLDVSENKVGIGTTSPSANLHVSGSGSQKIDVTDTGGVSTRLSVAGSNAFLGTTTNHDQLFITNDAERMRIDSSGNVGIGTSSPNSYTNFTTLTLDGTTGSEIDLEAGAVKRGALYAIATEVGLQTSSATNLPLTFGTNGSERMRIDSSGNVGIGVTPNFYQGSGLEIERAGVTTLRLQNTTSGKSAEIKIDTNLILETINSSSPIQFNTGAVERMRIDSSGDVGIGVSSPSARLHIYDGANATEATAQLKIEGSGYVGFHWLDGTAYYIGQNSAGRALRIYSSAETAGVQLSAGGTSFGTFSDERLKENIQDIGSVTDKIKDIRCVSFNRTDIEDSKETIGFIAQDFVGKFDQVLDKTKLKDGNEEEYYSIKYTETIPVLLKAIQEQQTIIDNLTTRIETLENA